MWWSCIPECPCCACRRRAEDCSHNWGVLSQPLRCSTCGTRAKPVWRILIQRGTCQWRGAWICVEHAALITFSPPNTSSASCNVVCCMIIYWTGQACQAAWHGRVWKCTELSLYPAPYLVHAAECHQPISCICSTTPWEEEFVNASFLLDKSHIAMVSLRPDFSPRTSSKDFKLS